MRFFLFVFLSCYSIGFYCQRANPHYLFIEHLTGNGKNKEAVHLLHSEKMNFRPDTFNFLLGYNHHFLKNTDSATFYLGRVLNESPFYFQARSYQTLNLLYGRNYDLAKNLLADVSSDNEHRQLFLLMQGATSLLQRDYASFDSTASGFMYDNYKYSTGQRSLLLLRDRLKKQKKKSPLIAGLLSTAVPGLGKFYAGKKGAGVAAFATNLILAGFVVESYYRSGVKSPQFITFGTIFAFFYTGNIFGSVYSVKQQIRSVNGRTNNEILTTVHIPVNRVFPH